MFAFLLIFIGAVVVVAAIGVAYAFSQRKRSGQSGQEEVTAQRTGAGSPSVGRPTGLN